MSLLLQSLVSLSGCASEDVAEASAECPAATVDLVERWEEDVLPATTSTEHTEPGIAVGDLDGDGDLDAFVAWGGGSFVLENDGSGGMSVDTTWTLDGGPLPDAAAVALADLDADGDLDGWLGREREQVSLHIRNIGGGAFETASVGDDRSPATGSYADADGDGDLDLAVAYLLTDVDPQLVLSGDQTGVGTGLFLQEGGTWVERALPPEQEPALSFQSAWIDAENDGDLDLYLGHVWGTVLVPNLLLLNDGAANFTVDVGNGAEKAMHSMGVAVGDANNDGYADLYVTDVGSPTLFYSDGSGDYYDGTFANGASVPPSATNLASWGTTFVDLDMDGCNDLVVTFGRLARDGQAELDHAEPEGEDWTDPEEQANVWLRGDCAGGFERVDGTSFDTELVRDRSVGVGDLDRDGDPDLLTVGKYSVRQWRVSGCGPGVTVALDGPSGNVDGLGARVSARVGDRVTTAWMLPSTTHGQSAMELYFGLGGAPQVDELVVEWPGGGRSVVRDIPAGPIVVTP